MHVGGCAVAGLSPQRPRADPGTSFVVDRVVLGMGLLEVLWFSPIIIIAPTLHTRIPFIYHQPI